MSLLLEAGTAVPHDRSMNPSAPDIRADRASRLATLRRHAAVSEAAAARRLEARRAEAWRFARETGTSLRRDYGATRVLVFGSLATGHFGHWSDVDVLAYGVPPSLRLAAEADLSTEPRRRGDLSIDVVTAEDVSPAIVAEAERYGIVIFDSTELGLSSA